MSLSLYKDWRGEDLQKEKLYTVPKRFEEDLSTFILLSGPRGLYATGTNII